MTKKGIIVVNYSKMKNVKVSRHLYTEYASYWPSGLQQVTSLLKVITAESSCMGHSLRGLNFHNRVSWLCNLRTELINNHESLH